LFLILALFNYRNIKLEEEEEEEEKQTRKRREGRTRKVTLLILDTLIP
tara:strand:+ start:1402 stop:1545 length:144 start_codon:yes stop_codon:yes gene_type:complete